MRPGSIPRPKKAISCLYFSLRGRGLALGIFGTLY
jgi:hypothetical protein